MAEKNFALLPPLPPLQLMPKRKILVDNIFLLKEEYHFQAELISFQAELISFQAELENLTSPCKLGLVSKQKVQVKKRRRVKAAMRDQNMLQRNIFHHPKKCVKFQFKSLWSSHAKKKGNFCRGWDLNPGLLVDKQWWRHYTMPSNLGNVFIVGLRTYPNIM